MPSSPAARVTTNSALADEIEAINSIYGDGTLCPTGSSADATASASHAILTLPDQPLSFILSFAPDYPASSPPHVNGTQSTRSSSKGEGTAAAQVLRDVLARVWAPGQVCLFDAIEEASGLLHHHHHHHGETEIATAGNGAEEGSAARPVDTAAEEGSNTDVSTDWPMASSPAPNWTLSEPVSEKKSVFVARCAAVSSRDDASSAIAHLLATNKKVAGATHNITAWRIQNPATGVTVQDCDDDGESAAGGHLLHLMQLMDVWNVVVVVTRWYGGTKLGPDRFRIINCVARDALVRARVVKGDEGKGHDREKGGRKKAKR
jgi:hypothetical protein